MSENPVDDAALAAKKEGLAHVETKKGESLKPVLKCADGHTTDVPADLQTKMDAEEDLGDLPACSTCSGATSISVSAA